MLENGRGAILDRSGRPELYGKRDVGPFYWIDWIDWGTGDRRVSPPSAGSGGTPPDDNPSISFRIGAAFF